MSNDKLICIGCMQPFEVIMEAHPCQSSEGVCPYADVEEYMDSASCGYLIAFCRLSNKFLSKELAAACKNR